MASKACHVVPALVLPFELQKHIASRCQPSDIASLALIHTFWTAACEEALYERVTLHQSASDNIFVGTIASNSRKAALVRTVDTMYLQLFTADSTLFCTALEHLRHLHFVRIPILQLEDLNKLVALMRSGGLNTLHALSVPARAVDYAGDAPKDALLDLHAAVRAQSARLRLVVLSAFYPPEESLLETFAATHSVITWRENGDHIALYPQLYRGPRRAAYLADCVWAVKSALFNPDFVPLWLSELHIRTSVDDLTAVGDVVHAMADCLPALNAVHLSFVAPESGGLLDAVGLAAALRPMSAKLSQLALKCDHEWWSALSALPELEFAKRLVNGGCTSLRQVVLPDEDVAVRSSQGHWSVDVYTSGD